ncbi:hypothetical protein AXX16_0759 [Serratia rubidaea]|nr:hypothetical protein AXX16_0759 [Serratia rubidaea]
MCDFMKNIFVYNRCMFQVAEGLSNLSAPGPRYQRIQGRKTVP